MRGSQHLVMWKGEITILTGHGGPQKFKTLKPPHFPNNRFTDGSKVVSLMHRPPLTPSLSPFLKDISVRGWSIPRSQGHSSAGRIRSIQNSTDLLGTRMRDTPACSTVPQPTTLQHAPNNLTYITNRLSIQLMQSMFHKIMADLVCNYKTVSRFLNPFS
jgi:hypothetical protein